MTTPALNLGLSEPLPTPATQSVTPAQPPSPRRSWLREPLLHFIVLGGLSFAVDHFVAAKTDDSNTIVVGADVDKEATDTFKAARGREPNAEEMEALQRVWLDNEVLYREGLALQVDKGDSAIRERVIFKALSVVDSQVKLPAIDENTLRAWFEAHRDKYDEPARFDFEEAALSGTNSEATVRDFVADLNKGTPGDAKAGLRVFKARPHSNIVEAYGADFAKAAALVKIIWLDGQSRVYTLTGSQPSVELYGSADDHRGLGEIFRVYTVLGVQHILSGIDHLLFVASLLFLVGFNRRLIGTITAFTLAHSLTLACSVFGWLTLRSAPVEACIALSIVLVASESLRDTQTLARRMPALVSFLFGLVHGLGFAGALKSIGLPQSHLPMALLSFNVGVELGQLMMVLLAFAVVSVPWPKGWLGRARRPALYAVGVVAAFWCWQRIAAIVA